MERCRGIAALILIVLALTACGGSASPPTVTPATAVTLPPIPSFTPTLGTTQIPTTTTPTFTPTSGTTSTAPISSSIGITPTITADMRTQLAAAEQLWQQNGARNYRIMVKIATFNIAQTNVILVRGGTVADQSATCAPLPSSGGTLCRVQPMQPETLTVPGLFDKALRLINDNTRQGRVTFDARYGYPTEISSMVPQVRDTESNEKVVSFEVLP